MAGNHLTDDDDRLIFAHDSKSSSVDVSAPHTELLSIERYFSLSNSSKERHNELYMLPLTVHDLAAIDALYNPPSISVCHELLFEAKAKISITDVRAAIARDNDGIVQFWKSFTAEVRDLFIPGRQPSLLPKLLKEMQSMLVHLYPESKCVVDEISSLDMDFVVDQLQKRYLSIHDLIKVIAAVFKANCAPKRDPIIDQILALASESCWINVFKLTVEMFEIMKMDLMNYRLVVGRDRVLMGHFRRECAYFDAMFKKDPLGINLTINWLEHFLRHKNLLSKKEMLAAAFVDILLSKHSNDIPETFSLDTKRIHALRVAIQEVLILACVFIGFEQVTKTKPSVYVATELKSRVLGFLGASECKISCMITQILLVAWRENKQLANSMKRDDAFKLLDNILHPQSHVCSKLRERLEILLTSLLLGKPIPFNMNSSRLSYFCSELNVIVCNAKLLWTINMKIHGPRYQSILTELFTDKS